MDNITEKFTIGDNVKEVVIRHKKDLDELKPVHFSIVGTINAPKLFIEKRIKDYKPEVDRSYILVNKEEKSITLTFNERDPLNIGQVAGKLVLSPELGKWKINSDDDEKWDPMKLAQFIKMNRSYIPTGEWMELFKKLSDVKIEVNKKIDASDDKRGTIKVGLAQEVISNSIPDKFNLFIPIFKGEERVSFEVEIYVDPSLVVISLHSPQLEEFIIEQTEERINAEIKEIKEMSPELVIMYC